MEYEQLVRDIQNIELDILKEFAALCERHGLRYTLYAGTLLGAIRHKGFIPWDDDGDVAMPLDDYRRFLELSHELPDRFVVQTPQSNREATSNWAVVCANGTTIMPKALAGVDVHWGVHLDVYPMIGGARSKFGRRLQTAALDMSGYLRSSECYKLLGEVATGSTGGKAILKRILSSLPFGVRKALADKLFSAAVIDPDKSDWVGTVDAVEFRAKFRKSDWENMTEGEFEGCSFPVPERYDVVLTTMYGNYMELPPEWQRVPHYSDCSTIRDVGRDYREYRKELIG